MPALVASLLSYGILVPDVRFKYRTASFTASFLLSKDRVTAYAGTHGLHTFRRLAVVETGKSLLAAQLNNKYTLCCAEDAPRLITEDRPVRSLQPPYKLAQCMKVDKKQILLQEIKVANT